MEFFFKIVLNAIAVFICGWILSSGIHIDSAFTGLLIAAVLVLLNTFLRPVLVFLTIPFTIFSFGLFLLVINAGIVQLAAYMIPGFSVRSFWWALWFSLLLSFFRSLLSIPEKAKNGQIRIEIKRNRKNNNEDQNKDNNTIETDYTEVE